MRKICNVDIKLKRITRQNYRHGTFVLGNACKIGTGEQWFYLRILIHTSRPCLFCQRLSWMRPTEKHRTLVSEDSLLNRSTFFVPSGVRRSQKAFILKFYHLEMGTLINSHSLL